MRIIHGNSVTDWVIFQVGIRLVSCWHFYVQSLCWSMTSSFIEVQFLYSIQKLRLDVLAYSHNLFQARYSLRRTC